MIEFPRVIPILRIFDVAKAREFYVDYLGFKVDWEHQFEPETPVYMQVSRGNLLLHLSEHHGDGTPGSAIYVKTSGVRELHAEIAAKQYKYLRPGISTDEIGTCVSVIDPFGNTIRFNEPPADRVRS